MTNLKDTTGKRWWVNEFLMKFTCNSAHKVAGKHYVVLEATPNEMKSFIAKVEEQAFRKGVEASLGALPLTGTSYHSDCCDDYKEEAKENIGKLIK